MAELHPQIRELVAESARRERPTTLEGAREDYERTALAWAGEPEAVAGVREVDADGVRVRVYAPEGDGPLPLVVWVHGGGWILGTLDAYDPLCSALANRSGAIVASVDYRLAPEAQFPEPVEDVERALRWLHAHAAELGADPDRFAIAGDSAGGNLAAVVARRARDHGGPPLRFQLLVYPVTDAACATRSMQDYGAGGFMLTADEMKLCWAAYAPDGAARTPDASPLRAASLAGLPPTLIVLAEADPLTDEGLDYAERLRADGVPVETSVYPGMVHGFFRWRGRVDAAHDAMDEAAAALRAALAGARSAA